MKIKISPLNAEEIIFHNDEIHKMLPEFNSYFTTWRQCKRHSALRSVVKKTVYDLLNKLEDSHIDLLENYFQQTVEVTKSPHNLSKNITTTADKLEERICEINNFSNFAISKNKDEVHLSFWK